jgi:hypothetical protein
MAGQQRVLVAAGGCLRHAEAARERVRGLAGGDGRHDGQAERSAGLLERVHDGRGDARLAGGNAGVGGGRDADEDRPDAEGDQEQAGQDVRRAGAVDGNVAEEEQARRGGEGAGHDHGGAAAPRW